MTEAGQTQRVSTIETDLPTAASGAEEDEATAVAACAMLVREMQHRRHRDGLYRAMREGRM